MVLKTLIVLQVKIQRILERYLPPHNPQVSADFLFWGGGGGGGNGADKNCMLMVRATTHPGWELEKGTITYSVEDYIRLYFSMITCLEFFLPIQKATCINALLEYGRYIQ